MTRDIGESNHSITVNDFGFNWGPLLSFFIIPMLFG